LSDVGEIILPTQPGKQQLKMKADRKKSKKGRGGVGEPKQPRTRAKATKWYTDQSGEIYCHPSLLGV
jgi:hypothetical protein